MTLTRLKRLSVLDREVRYNLGLLGLYETFGTLSDFGGSKNRTVTLKVTMTLKVTVTINVTQKNLVRREKSSCDLCSKKSSLERKIPKILFRKI